MTKNRKRSFIYNLDILSGKPGLFITGHKNYSPLGGLIITLSILLIFIIYSIYALYIFFLKEKCQ